MSVNKSVCPGLRGVRVKVMRLPVVLALGLFLRESHRECSRTRGAAPAAVRVRTTPRGFQGSPCRSATSGPLGPEFLWGSSAPLQDGPGQGRSSTPPSSGSESTPRPMLVIATSTMLRKVVVRIPPVGLRGVCRRMITQASGHRQRGALLRSRRAGARRRPGEGVGGQTRTPRPFVRDLGFGKVPTGKFVRTREFRAGAHFAFRTRESRTRHTKGRNAGNSSRR